MKIFLMIFVVALFTGTASQADTQTPPSYKIESIWSLDAPKEKNRWVVIRNEEIWNGTQIYHVEVLEQLKGQDPWMFERLSPHLVITETALKASLRENLKRGNVNPEAYSARYDEWKKLLPSAQDMFMCRTSIEDCLQLK